MSRESLDPGAVMAAMGISGTPASTYFRFFSRTIPDTNCATKLGAKTVVPAWLRLERKGDTITGYASTDGLDWSVVSSMALKEGPENLLVGIFGIGRESAGSGSFSPLQARVCLEGPPPPAFVRGDANGDQKTDVSDAIAVLFFLFLGSTEKPGCQKAADVDDSGVLDISDAVYLLGFQFLGGPAPPRPFPACGADRTSDELTCETFEGCP
jgi:hypothetical protein